MWHLEVCCHGDPQNIPIQLIVIFLLKFKGFDFTVWCGSEDVKWRCQLFFLLQRISWVYLHLRNFSILCHQLLNQQLTSLLATNYSKLVTMNNVCVYLNTHVCLNVCVHAYVHAQMCIFTTVWLTSHIRHCAAENWDNTVSKRKLALTELKEQQA